MGEKRVPDLWKSLKSSSELAKLQCGPSVKWGSTELVINDVWYHIYLAVTQGYINSAYDPVDRRTHPVVTSTIPKCIVTRDTLGKWQNPPLFQVQVLLEPPLPWKQKAVPPSKIRSMQVVIPTTNPLNLPVLLGPISRLEISGYQSWYWYWYSGLGKSALWNA